MIASAVRILLAVCCLAASVSGANVRTVWLIGDSTVHNGTKGLLGWGTTLAGMYDSKKVKIENRALSGRSSRSYLEEGNWAKVLKLAKSGDFVIMQFGHNDDGDPESGDPLPSLKGSGSQTLKLKLGAADGTRVVHTYGWYLRNYIDAAKAAKLNTVVCSPVPRNVWKDGRVVRADADFAKWAGEAAKDGGVWFVDLNRTIADRYDAMGPEKVRAYFPFDSTHTNAAGAQLNAQYVIDGMKAVNCPLGFWARVWRKK